MTKKMHIEDKISHRVRNIINKVYCEKCHSIGISTFPVLQRFETTWISQVCNYFLL